MTDKLKPSDPTNQKLGQFYEWPDDTLQAFLTDWQAAVKAALIRKGEWPQ